MADAAAVTPPPKAWVPKDSFANRLILIRRELDLTQAEAAAKCGLDDGSWSNWENGSRPRGMDTVVATIARGLGVDRDWLMWGAESRPTRSDYYGTAGLRLAAAREKVDGRYRKVAAAPLLATV